MDFLELASKRYSTRNFQPTPVAEADLAKILEAGRVAPTARNNQPHRLLVVRTEEALARLSQGARVHGAPLVIIVCADHQVSWKRAYDSKDVADIDASIVTTHLLLQATALGLGTLWICNFNPGIIRSAFAIPDHLEPVNILAIGYEAGEPKAADRHASQRKPLEDLIVWEGFPADSDKPANDA